MTIISPDDIERNWLWLAVDKSGQLASFQSFGASLPATVVCSLEEAELVDEFVADIFKQQQGYSEARFCHEHAGYHYPPRSSTTEDEGNWNTMIEGSIRAASCGFFIYCREQAGEIQYAAPQSPRTIDLLPEQIRSIVSRSCFRNVKFDGLDLITPTMIAKIGQ